MENKKKIKIFVSCGRECFVPDNALFVPVQTAAAGKPHIEGMLRDDVGDNISEKYPSFCELTTQYYAWKNEDADYFGFFHENKFLSFNIDKKYCTDDFNEIPFLYFDAGTAKKLWLDENSMRPIVEECDLIVPKRGGVRNALSFYNQFKFTSDCHIEDLDFCMGIIKRDHPEMYRHAIKYLSGNKGYLCNVFIMKKELFTEYCEWLFPILFEHEASKDFSAYDIGAYLVSRILAELLCGIYISWLIKTQPQLKVRTLQLARFENIDKIQFLKPYFENDNVALVLSANDYYAPYLATILESVAENASPNRNYDIIILTRDIIPRNRDRICRQMNSYKNFKIRFFDITRFMEPYTNLYTRDHFRIETYFRLLMPEILPDYDKVLYLDSDMVVLSDVAELYDIDIDGYLLAASKDADTAGLYNGAQNGRKYFTDEVLKLKKPYEYFQAGVILFNLKEFRKAYTVDGMMEFAASYPWQLLDQDVLNYLAQGRTKFFDMSWNVIVDWKDKRINNIIARAPRALYLEYMASREHPKIIHFAGPDKPWEIPDSDFAEYFWEYAQKTVFYEVIYNRLIPEQFHKHDVKKKKSLKGVVKGMAMPFVNFAFPKGSLRREKLKYILNKRRQQRRNKV